MIKIYLETGKPQTPEYVFIDTLLKEVMNIDSSKYTIECVNGKDNLPNSANSMLANSAEGGKNLIIFDADNADNGGGFSVRKEELEGQMKQLGIEAALFLFPNNVDDGDVETLMEALMQKEKHKCLLDCYSDYEKCVGNTYNLPNRKNKLHTYITAMKMSNSARKKIGMGNWHFSNPEYWNMNVADILPLRNFLKLHFTSN